MGYLRYRGQVGYGHEGVGGALYEGCLRLGADGLLDIGGIGRVNRAKRDAKMVEHLVEDAICATIHIGGKDHLVP